MGCNLPSRSFSTFNFSDSEAAVADDPSIGSAWKIPISMTARRHPVCADCHTNLINSPGQATSIGSSTYILEIRDHHINWSPYGGQELIGLLDNSSA